MHLLQAVADVETDWTGPAFFSIALVLVFYTIALVVFYFVIRAAVRSGTAEMRRQNNITNLLHAEDLRLKGVSGERIDQIMGARP